MAPIKISSLTIACMAVALFLLASVSSSYGIDAPPGVGGGDVIGDVPSGVGGGDVIEDVGDGINAPPGVGGGDVIEDVGDGINAPPGVGGGDIVPPGDDGGDAGTVVICIPAFSCASLGCNAFDSCGTFCGACPVPVPVPVPAPVPAPVPVPAPAPVSVEVVFPPALPKPLQAIGLRFPFQQLFMRSVSFPDSDCVRPGESALLAVKVRNTGKSTLKGVSFTATVPEIGARSRSGPHTIKTADKFTRFLRLDVPDDAQEGDYYLRLTVTNNKFTRTVYRAFTVGGSC